MASGARSPMLLPDGLPKQADALSRSTRNRHGRTLFVNEHSGTLQFDYEPPGPVMTSSSRLPANALDTAAAPVFDREAALALPPGSGAENAVPNQRRVEAEPTADDGTDRRGRGNPVLGLEEEPGRSQAEVARDRAPFPRVRYLPRLARSLPRDRMPTSGCTDRTRPSCSEAVRPSS